ncbi:MAG TPA: RidA family protein [Alphaproteobacteria bacterium]|nr:RidA family protein [Alphaproteobacteria bacterium]
MKRERIDPGWAWLKKFNISAGEKIGDTIWLSGAVAFDEEGNVVGGDDLYAQAKKTFENIEAALASAGANMSDVVKINTFLTDLSRYAEYGKARTEAFPGGVPASTVVGTTALVRPELLVEVEAVAVIGSGG